MCKEDFCFFGVSSNYLAIVSCIYIFINCFNRCWLCWSWNRCYDEWLLCYLPVQKINKQKPINNRKTADCEGDQVYCACPKPFLLLTIFYWLTMDGTARVSSCGRHWKHWSYPSVPNNRKSHAKQHWAI